MDKRRDEMVQKIFNFIDNDGDRKPELLFKKRPYPSSGAELLPKHYEQAGLLADFILSEQAKAVAEVVEPLEEYSVPGKLIECNMVNFSLCISRIQEALSKSREYTGG